MYETIVKVDGMMCGMCESHVNDAVRKAFPVKKVTSSHVKGETVILQRGAAGRGSLKAAIAATGYDAGEVTVRPYEKKGLFGFLKK